MKLNSLAQRCGQATALKGFIVLASMLLGVLVTVAQDNVSAEPITADNITRLESVTGVDFRRFDNPFDTGWFAINAAGTAALTGDQTGMVHTQSIIPRQDDSGMSYRVSSDEARANIIDAAFSDFGSLSIHNIDGEYILRVGEDLHTLELDGTPISIWAEGRRFWVEVLPDDYDSPARILEFALEDFIPVKISEIDYAPAQDPEVVVRIGRIPPPYAVTSSLTGWVKLWNIQTGEILHEADNGTGEPSVFGNINADATHLVWRDNANESLYLLDFETGENRFIADLGGQYAQWFFLSNDASVILAVNLDFEPNVFAWIVETGERIDLGPYRACERPQPDMSRLSRDGTTLVIGCDSGLDVWRVAP